ncbi:MAG: PAS domain-containing sensor histidine kinase [Alphaproteobacteria bacterium]|nr:PAS domain-containing sensor histidine kinase [Alphaproteobacteria bacterium]
MAGLTPTQKAPAAPEFTLWRRFYAWAQRRRLSRKLVIVLTVAAAICGIATYAALSGSVTRPAPRSILALLLADLVLLLALGVLVARKLVKLWYERKQGTAGARLHVRLVGLFGVVAVAPTIIVAFFSMLFLELGLQSWFSERVSRALHGSLAVAEAYVEEHGRNIVGDVLAMASDLGRQALSLQSDPALFDETMRHQATLRSLNEAVVTSAAGQVLARAPLSLALEFDRAPAWAYERANGGEVVLLSNQAGDRVRALSRMQGFPEAYLIVGRFIESRVVGHIDGARRAIADYENLEGARSSIQITFAAVFIVVAILLLLAAMLIGLNFASRLVGPVGQLARATERVSRGDLTARVPDGPDDDEIATLSRAFNSMTGRLETQHRELVDANIQLDERRRFTEAVLAGVTAGVLGLDPEGRIELPNRSAVLLLETEAERLIGRALPEAAPELAPLFEEARAKPDRVAQGEIELVRDDRRKSLLVRVTAERDGDTVKGFVVTFDEITELVAAQRTAAWADVARRIAHEIKNPLTPIQLSAERLKRKYLKEISTDPEVFIRCTDTIIRQVLDIGRMVDEFSSFARMPRPVFRDEDIGEIARHALFLQQIAHPEITYDAVLPEGPLACRCDGRQVAQAITNILKNAAEAIQARRETDEAAPQGRVELVVRGEGEGIQILVRDNGRGLPRELKDRLTEPYVTTRARGTGLGLAIVKKIVEDHGGTLILENRDEGGAIARFVLPAAGLAASEGKSAHVA